jgi:MFS family permease
MTLVSDDAAATPKEKPLRRNRDFMLLWTGAGLTLFGVRVSMLAYPLLVLWHGGDAKAAGMVTAAALLPHLLVQLPAGALVDRVDRRRLMLFCDAMCVLLIGSVTATVLMGHYWLWHLMIVAFVQSSLGIFYVLAERSAVRHLVPASQLPTALTQNEARERAAGMLGEPAGSVFFTITSWLPFGVTTLSHLGSFLTLLFIRKPFQARRTDAPHEPILTDIKAGIAWVWQRRFLRTVLLFIALSNIPFEGLTLAVMVMINDLKLPPAIVGVVIAIGGIGGVAGAVCGTWWMRRVTMRGIVVGGLAAWALLMPLAAFTDDIYLLGAIFAGCSYVGGLFNVVGGVYMVRITPDAMMGRVGSVATLMASGTNFVGAFAAGFLIDSLGTDHAILALSGLMVVLVALAVASPAVRNVVRTPEGGKLTDGPASPDNHHDSPEGDSDDVGELRT